MVKRIIFDIDYTILIPNYRKEYLFLQNYVKADNTYFIRHMHEILKEYETLYPKYEVVKLLKHLNKYSDGVILDEGFLEAWANFSVELEKQDVTITHEVLSYLNSKYELVALSNWFRKVQIGKLERLDLLKYFIDVYGGDDYLKPNLESFHMAIERHRPEECIMIGDNLDADIKGALNAGLQAIHYTNGREVEHGYQKVKYLSELKKIL